MIPQGGERMAPRDERTMALLGAATGRGAASPTETCLAEEAMAAYIDNRLGSAEREKVLAHLVRCPRCYREWLEAATFLSAPAAEHESPVILHSLPRGRNLTGFLSSWRLVLPAAAVVVVTAVIVFWPPTPDLAERIDSSYAGARASAPSEVAEIARALRLPWEQETLSFSGSAALPAQRAFGAGLWAGRAALLGNAAFSAIPRDLAPPGQGSWQDSAWADFYQLGRWVLVLRTLASTAEPAAQDWLSYREALSELRARLAHRTGDEMAKRAVLSLDSIEPVLTRLQTDAPGDAREALVRSLDTAMNQLAP